MELPPAAIHASAKTSGRVPCSDSLQSPSLWRQIQWPDCRSPAPAVYTTAAAVIKYVPPAPVTEYVAAGPITEYGKPAPVTECVKPSPAVTYTTADTTGVNLEITDFMNPQSLFTTVEASAPHVMGSSPPLEEFAAPGMSLLHQEQTAVGKTGQNIAVEPIVDVSVPSEKAKVIRLPVQQIVGEIVEVPHMVLKNAFSKTQCIMLATSLFLQEVVQTHPTSAHLEAYCGTDRGRSRSTAFSRRDHRCSSSTDSGRKRGGDSIDAC